jgi:hypothetical protein
MPYPNLVSRVVQMVKNSGTKVSVVNGSRTEDLDLPCISCTLESTENFNVALTDVHRVNILVRYEEHFADKSSENILAEFQSILDRFMIDDLNGELAISGNTIFQSSVAGISTAVEGDILVNEFYLEIIAERNV